MRAALAVAAGISLVAGCAPAKLPAAPSAGLVLQIRQSTGKPGPGGAVNLPEVALYGDRRLIVPGERLGALQTALVYHLSAKRFEKIYRDANEAGLATASTRAATDVVDGPTVQYTLVTAAGQAVTETYGAREDDALGEFRAGLDPGDWPESAFEAPPQRYAPAQLAVLARVAQPGTPPAGSWPFGSLAGVRVPGAYCTELGPPNSEKAVRLSSAHDPRAAWSSDGTAYRIDLRPLLPHENGCQSLA
jgi:hypothetical protein